MSFFAAEITPEQFWGEIEELVLGLAIRHPELAGEAIAAIGESRARRGVPPEERLAWPLATFARLTSEAAPKGGPEERPSKRSRSI